MRSCSACAAPIPGGDLYCPGCGAAAPTEVGDVESPPHGTPAEGFGSRKAALQKALGSGFEVQRLVGRGGFGEVWAVADLQLVRTVAVKVLRPELVASRPFRVRFRREARAVAKLRHPGIVPIYHVGESGDLFFFIMPLVEGVTLKAALEQQGSLSPEEASRILIEASSALQEAHRHGIVHRDLKPENVMLEGSEQRVLLMDFGIAQTEEAPDAEEDKELTGANMVLGSPEYMSPEQATGRRELDGRSDIYSLGVVAYRMLSGRLPFSAGTARELLIKHVTTPPEPLQNVPPALADAVMRCLAKLPEERWQTPDEFLSALGNEERARRSSASAAQTPVVVPGPPVVSPFERRRARRILVAAGILVLLGAATILGSLQYLRWRERERVTAVGRELVTIYGDATDSLRILRDRFTSGSANAMEYLTAQEALLAGMEQRTTRSFGAIEDSLAELLPEGPLRAVRTALDTLWESSLTAQRLLPGASATAGCRLERGGGAVLLLDSAASGNCWYAAEPTPRSLAAPVEYYFRFRVPEETNANAGVGLAWCGATVCRIAFLWAGDNIEWAAYRSGGSLRTLQLGRRLPSLAGSHQLRVRLADGRIRVWLDGRLVLNRTAPADAPFLTEPESLRVVVQNATLELPGAEALGFVGKNRP